MEISNDVIADFFDEIAFPVFREGLDQLLNDPHTGFSDFKKLAVLDGLISAGQWFFTPDNLLELREIRQEFIESVDP